MDIQNRLNQEEIKLASIANRIKAHIVDSLLLFIIIFIAYYDTFDVAFGSGNIEQISIALNNLLVVIVVLNIAYHTFFIYMYGATIGKIIFRIKIVNMDDFEKPNLHKSLLRAMIRTFGEAFLLSLNFVWAFFDHQNRHTWQDKFCSTLAIDSKVNFSGFNE